MNDLELLRKYVQDGSEAAFAELARRYVSLVYTAAMRHVHNAQDAEDVTQAVFLLLARKSRSLSKSVVVPGWLLRATHFASKTLLRARARRQRHESRAATMKQTTSGSSMRSNGSAPDWDRVAPLLDEAIAALANPARDALVLRFFRNKSYREVAERLSIAEPAARQRVARAVEQLRNFFANRGVVLTTAALEGLVVGHGVQPAPAALVPLAAALGVKGAAVAARHAVLAQGAAMAMVPASVKVGLVAAIVLIVGAVSMTVYEGHRGDRSALVAAGAPAAITPIQVQSAPIRGRVIDPTGRPAVGAEVLLARASTPVSVYAARGSGVLAVKSGPDGSFEFPSQSDATAIVARSDEGVAQVRVADLQTIDVIRLVPWGRIEGTLKVGNAPQVGQTVELSRTGGSLAEWYAWRIMHEARARTDGRGHFVFDRVIPLPPGTPNQLELKWRAPSAAGQRFAQFWVAPRQTLKVQLGGTGRPVIGRLNAPPGLPPFVGQLVAQPPASQPARAIAWRPAIIPVVASADGSFRADDVPAGAYNLVLISAEAVRGAPISEAAAQANTQVIVPEMAGGRSDQPLDVGTLAAVINVRLSPGKPAPDFVANLPDGRSILLSDMRGKFVLLHLRQAGTDDEQWVRTSDLKVIRDRFGGRNDFVLLDVPFSPQIGPTAESQSILARIAARVRAMSRPDSTRPATAPSSEIPQVYLSSATRLFLIGPDGTCLAPSLESRSAFSRLAEMLPRQARSDPNVVLHIEHRPPSNGAAIMMASSTYAVSSSQNVARAARFAVVAGERGDLSAGLSVLNDGRLAGDDDQPVANFFFSHGSLEGRFRMDLAEPIEIGRINSYSRHRTHRGPQVYIVYGSDGQASGFNPQPPIGVDPASCGWTQIADVDTRPAQGPAGGQYAVSLTARSGVLGKFRHLLFVTFVTETDDDIGQTFYSEIEVFRGETHP
jgi:RNA polymerase sigma factor (sigma-70 family)